MRRTAPGPTEKWGRYVDGTALAYFKDAEDDYEVRFHADRVRYRPAFKRLRVAVLSNSG